MGKTSYESQHAAPRSAMDDLREEHGLQVERGVTMTGYGFLGSNCVIYDTRGAAPFTGQVDAATPSCVVEGCESLRNRLSSTETSFDRIGRGITHDETEPCHYLLAMQRPSHAQGLVQCLGVDRQQLWATDCVLLKGCGMLPQPDFSQPVSHLLR